jgi:hypothetical protein
MKKFLKALFSCDNRFEAFDYRVKRIQETLHECSTCRSFRKGVCIKNSFFNPVKLYDYCEQWFPREEFLK